MPVKFAPSILACDFTRLGDEVSAVHEAEYLHVDVMDGMFVPNISFGLPIVAATKRAAAPGQIIDVHLMIERPERYLADFAAAGAGSLTVHVEATAHLHRAIQMIHGLGCRAGVVLNPGTSLETLRPVLQGVDLVLIMSVNPGFGGQQFLPSALERIRTVRGWLGDLGSAAELQVDGGVGPGNAQSLVDAGASVLVAGSSVYGQDGGAVGLSRLRASVNDPVGSA